jgi:hypothetical protein
MVLSGYLKSTWRMYRTGQLNRNRRLNRYRNKRHRRKNVSTVS